MIIEFIIIFQEGIFSIKYNDKRNRIISSLIKMNRIAITYPKYYINHYKIMNYR